MGETGHQRLRSQAAAVRRMQKRRARSRHARRVARDCATSTTPRRDRSRWTPLLRLLRPAFVSEEVRSVELGLPCRWREPGKLQPSCDVGVFPHMGAKEGGGSSALLSGKSRAIDCSHTTPGRPARQSVAEVARRRALITACETPALLLRRYSSQARGSAFRPDEGRPRCRKQRRISGFVLYRGNCSACRGPRSGDTCRVLFTLW
jgi:hypothetical protein